MAAQPSPAPATSFKPIPIFSSSLSTASGNLSVPVPCSGPGTPLRSCDAVINGEAAGPRPGSSPVPALTTILYSRINQQASCAYQGIDYDPSQATAAGQCAGPTLGHPCSLVGIPFNNWTQETNQDFNGVACDNNYMSIVVNHSHCSLPQTSTPPTSSEETQLAQILASQYGISSPSQLDALATSDPAKAESIMSAISAKYPDLVGSVQSGSSSGGGQSNCVYFNATKPSGERERTWSRGAWLQAMSYYTQQVLNEITCTHSLQVNADPLVDGCAVFAQDAITQYNNALTAGTNVSTLGGASAAADIDFCKADWSGPNSAGQTDPGRLRQASQHLCAARSHLETVFAHLATCEILQRTRANFDKNIGLTEASRQSNFINNLVNGSAMRAQCDYCRKSSSYSQATSCMNACYQKNIGQDYQQYLQNLWNLNQPASCPNPVPSGKPYSFPNQKSSSSSGLGFGLFVGFLGRRSKKKSSRRLGACIGLGILLILAGCSKAQNLPSVPTTSPSNTACAGGDPACCGSSPPSSCPTENAGGASQASTGVSGAAEVANTGTEVGLAQGLASGASGSTNGYSAEGGTSATANSGSTSAVGSGGQVTAAAPTWLGGPGSSSSSSGSSSGGGSSLGSSADVTTAAASPTPAGLVPNPNASGSAAGSGSSYGAGSGGAGASARNASSGGFGFGSGASMGGAGAGSDVGFGNTAGTAAMNGTDPEDYFQRIAVEGDLFKQVENRYRETSANWAAANAGANEPAMSDAGAATVSQHPQPQK